MPRQFQLPMTLTHLVTKTDGRCVAHSLDFDIVEVGANEEEAWERLTAAVKAYVEFGLSKGWDDYILFDAPDEYQRKITPDMEVQIMPPLEIASKPRNVIRMRPHESKRAA